MKLIKIEESYRPEWKNDYEYAGMTHVKGLYRGVNVEFEMPNGDIDYSSCIFIVDEDINESSKITDNIRLVEHISGGKPTGRAIFRGFYESKYDFDYREEVFIPIEPNEMFWRYM